MLSFFISCARVLSPPKSGTQSFTDNQPFVSVSSIISLCKYSILNSPFSYFSIHHIFYHFFFLLLTFMETSHMCSACLSLVEFFTSIYLYIYFLSIPACNPTHHHFFFLLSSNITVLYKDGCPYWLTFSITFSLTFNLFFCFVLC